MKRAKILIVEDESIVAKDIQVTLEKLGYDVVGTIAEGEKVLDIVKDKTPDLILMDIMLKGKMTGIDVSIQIHKEISVPIIYMTAYADKDTLSKAKMTQPHGYIIKPYKEVDLRTTVEIALYKHKKEEKIKKERDLYYSIIKADKDSDGSIFVKSKYQLVKVKTQEIYFIEALKDYVRINTIDHRYIIHSTMKSIKEKLPAADFARVHRSFIVRLDKISAIEFPNIIIEHDMKHIPIGSSYKNELMNKLKLV
ncbi:MAG TPA: response regulator transcription factor [Flavobacteriales bacterium]|nr:response regulator transcription factor [Flavobacteriales bacterium]HIA07268.1 response regulator transcription factor [Flavobacteriales bacterium]HIO67137.1 response regulator transcription factor [Flavobacteriales bacterium]